MTQKATLFYYIFLLIPLAIVGQEPTDSTDPAKISEASVFVASEFPALFDEIKIDGYEQLEGAITVEDKAASVTYAPFLLRQDYNFLSETRFKIGQKDNLTSLGLQFRYNPISPRSKYAGRIFEKIGSELGIVQDEHFVQIRTAQRKLENFQNDENIKAEPKIQQIQTEIAILKQQIDTAPAPPNKKELEKQVASKMTELSGLVKSAERKRIAELLQEISELEKSIATANTAERDRLGQEVEAKQHALALGKPEIDALKTRLADLQAAFEKRNSTKLLTFYEALLNTRRPVVGISSNVTFFPVLNGGFSDSDNDHLNDNEYRINSRSIALTADFRLDPKFQISGLAGHTWKRPTAEKGSKVGESDNYGLTLGWVARTLNKNFRESEEFKESLFIPSIVLGLSAENSNCSSTKLTCVDGIDSQMVVTLFADFKIKKASQFRLGLPWKRTKKISGPSDESVGVVSVIAFQLGQPK